MSNSGRTIGDGRYAGPPPQSELLAKLAELINRHGPDSSVVAEFVDTHSANKEFVSLAATARELKKALSSPPEPDGPRLTEFARNNPRAAQAALLGRIGELERDNRTLVTGLCEVLNAFRAYNDGECVAAVIPTGHYDRLRKLVDET